MKNCAFSPMITKIIDCPNRSRIGQKNNDARRAISIVLLVVLSTLSACGLLTDQQSFQTQNSADFFSYLDNHIPRWMSSLDVPGVSIAVIRDGEVVWSNAYGFADRENGVPMTVNTICRAESISKSVTAWGVLRLVEQGQLELDVPIAEYLTDQDLLDLPINARLVTTRMLLGNTAGLPIGTIGKEAEFTLQDQLPSLKEYLLAESAQISDPGHTFLYSNVGFNWLELLVERASGRVFVEYMQNEILSPLGMRAASYGLQNDLFLSLAPGYDLQGKHVAPYMYPVQASGGLLADVESIARFVISGLQDGIQDQGSVLTRESIQLLYTPHIKIPGLFGLVADFYGFGHFIEDLPEGGRAVWHGGQGHGWMTHFHANPETGDGIVILTNSQRSWPLIAKILSAWSEWTGFGPVKFSRINYGSIAMQMFIVIIVLSAIWEMHRLVQELIHGQRKWAPFSRAALTQRILKIVTGIAIMSALIWISKKPYSFVSSIFPATARIAGISLFGFCIISIISALFPRAKQSAKRFNRIT